MLPLVPDAPDAPFDAACRTVVDLLKTTVPLAHWSVTRYDGDHQVYLVVRDDFYEKVAGDHVPWSATMCRRAVSGDGPQIAPDVSAVPLYSEIVASWQIQVGSFVSIPVVRADGSVFGTLCGFDPVARPSTHLMAHRALLDALVALLGSLLEIDLARVEAARALEQAEWLASTDPLTGLVNRRGWEVLLGAEEERYRRFATPGAVVIVDLDGVKAVNDSGGHLAGDLYLRLAAETLTSAVRTGDVVARLGGDEFGIMLTDSTLQQTAGLIARLRAALAGAGVAASIGHCPFTGARTFLDVGARADAAMYEEKFRRRAETPEPMAAASVLPGTGRLGSGAGPSDPVPAD